MPVVLVAACVQPASQAPSIHYSTPAAVLPTSAVVEIVAESTAFVPEATAIPTHRPYAPAELVDYTAQTGDTLDALAVRFNTSIDEIRAANPIIPADATTMPPGMPMKIPIYYTTFWGSAYQILPDSLYPNGPAQVGFNTDEFVISQPGWLRYYTEYASGATRNGAAIVELVAYNFSVSPRLLLALVEYHAGGLTQPTLPAELAAYPLGYEERNHKGLYLQLVWAANTLNNGYYGWRSGRMTDFMRLDGHQERGDPWQNAASMALHYYFSRLFQPAEYEWAISAQGFAVTYKNLFGDPWQDVQPHIPGSVRQPAFRLPYEPGKTWALTGGPHTGWGIGDPWAALDFAPGVKGCGDTKEWVTAVASGVVARVDVGTVVLDLDADGVLADGDERTGWVVFHLHIATVERAPLGSRVNAGDPIGHPSCEGGASTGTHVHIARKYNGEWVLASGTLAFDLEGWVAGNGERAYLGTLTRADQVVRACTCSDRASQVQAGR
ncbi:MAG: LysM peptidoglycan-binding domain-containing protein [Chloroflexota bacterium]